MMGRGLYVATMVDGSPSLNGAIYDGSIGRGWVLCSEIVNGKAIVMINAPDWVIDNMGAGIDLGSVDTFAAMYNTSPERMTHAFVGVHSVKDGDIPVFTLPGSTIPPSDKFPPVATGLREMLIAAKSGDVVSAAEGTYQGDFTVPVGVTLRPESGARVVLDILNELDMRAATVRDIEIYSSVTDKTIAQSGINMSAVNSRLIGCTVHNLRSSGVFWFSSGAGEISECVIYDCGYIDPATGRGHGHAIYTHNNLGGVRLIENNIMLWQRGDYRIQVYSGSSNALRDYTVRDNITVGSNIVGGGSGVYNLLYEDNVQYGSQCYIGRYSNPNYDCIVRRNLFQWVPYFEVTDFQTAVVEDNEDVTTQRVVINACAKSAGKLAHIAVMNPEGLASVAIDLSSLELAHGNYLLIEPGASPVTHEIAWAGEPVTVALTGVFHVYILKPV